MENKNNLEKMHDDELDQVTGGLNLFDIFTAEFRGNAKKPITLEMLQDEEDDEDSDFGVSTLEMRANPMRKKKNKKVVKL